MHIRINDFAGTLPRLHPTKLPDYAAQSCLNAMVEHGILSPSKKADQSFTSNQSGLDKFLSAVFFQNNDKTYKKFSNSLVSFAFSPVHESYRLYWTTEDDSRALMFNSWRVGDTGDLVTDNFDYIAGMPPVDASNISVTGANSVVPASNILNKNKSANSSSNTKKTDDEISDQIAAALEVEGDIEARVYAFTYVNRFGDESVPSVKEDVLYINKGVSPILNIPYSSGTREMLTRDYGVTKIRLYRSVTNSLGVAQFLYIKEVGLSMTGNAITITDDVPKGSLMIGEPLPTINYDPPRLGMKGLGVTDSGVGYAYIDKTICFSEPFILYAWPRYYELSAKHRIMGIGHYDNTIVVVTTGNPILINGESPENMGALSLPLYEGCVSSRSMVNLNHGCMYASENGLVLVTTNSAKLLTEGMFATDDWQKIEPSSIHACAYKNGYLFFWNSGSKKGSGYIDLNNPNKGVLWFDDYALNAFLDNGQVQMITRQTDYYNVTKSVYAAFNPEYGQPASNKKFVWQSKIFNLDTPKRMLAAQVIADDYSAGVITFRVYANGILLHENFVSSAKPFRVKNHSVKHDFSIEIESSTPIREVVLGETMRDLLA